MTSTESLSGMETVPAKRTEKAMVRYSYTAENEDELTLTEGDVINILDKELEDGGWWKGELGGNVGVFPDNFVEIIQEEPSAVKAPPRATPPEITPTPQPQPKPKKPPPPVALPTSAAKQAPKLPDKAPVADSQKPDHSKPEHHKPDHSKSEHKEEKPSHPPPTVPMKKVGHQPPPPVGKKPHKPEPPKQPESHRGKEESHEPKETESSSGHFDSVEPVGEKLVHLTASRAKGPSKRPPSQVFVQNDGETNGDVKESHCVKEERPAPSAHVNIPASIAEKKEETTIKDKPHHVPARPPEPAPATAGLQSAIEELRREMKELRTHTVSKAAFNELKAENEQLKKDVDNIKHTYSRRLKDIMLEVDEEKKLRLGTQVEMERIRKLVSESHV